MKPSVLISCALATSSKSDEEDWWQKKGGGDKERKEEKKKDGWSWCPMFILCWILLWKSQRGRICNVGKHCADYLTSALVCSRCCDNKSLFTTTVKSATNTFFFVIVVNKHSFFGFPAYFTALNATDLQYPIIGTTQYYLPIYLFRDCDYLHGELR